ncbi:MAG TPA: VIT domain-containing protein [Longimicrobiales bacterium]|nr:VIT domain-containing protein [Longimicrobiales bacterium]
MKHLALGATLFVLSVPSGVAAQGWVEPWPVTRPQPWDIEKLRTVVNVTVDGRVATVEVEEWFRNNGGTIGEGDYVYPLAGEAVFTGYSLYQGDDELRGEMMDARRAREIYESIVRARRDPALIELLGKGMVRARLFPIEPGETRRVTLRYTQLLERVGDGVQFRHVAGGRHAGLQPMGVPPQRTRDAAPLTFTITVLDGQAWRDPVSPTHELAVERTGGRLMVRPAKELHGDVAVVLPAAGPVVGVTAVTHNPAGDDGYFMLTLTPGAVAASRVPRDITAVVDVSGSMSGEKMEQARSALRQLLGTLHDSDRFRLIAFSNTVRPWRDDWAQATRAGVREAQGWVDALRADGGTNISGALEHALQAASPADRLPILVFMTDGLPTVGETRAGRIIAHTEAARGRTRIFAFGVGYDVNTRLLDALGAASRGTTQYVSPGESVEPPVSLLAARIRYPVLTDVTLDGSPVRLTEIYPQVLPDLFAGEDLVLFGRYAGSGTGELAVAGRREGRRERYAASVAFPARDETGEYLPRLWASRKLGDLDRRLRSAAADGASPTQLDEIRGEMRELALRYGLLSDETAYLVTEPMVATSFPSVPGRLPAVREAMVVAPAVTAVSGEAAVLRAQRAQQSMDVRSLAELDAVHAAPTRSVADGPGAGAADGDTRGVAGRLFTRQAGVWRDVHEPEGLRVISVEPYSSAYFALLQALPELAAVLRVLDPVRVTGEQLIIEMTPGGVSTMTEQAIRDVVTAFRQRAADASTG